MLELITRIEMHLVNPGDGNQESVGQPATSTADMSTAGEQRSLANLTEDDFIGGRYIRIYLN